MRQPREAPAWLKHDKQAWHGTRGQGDAAGIWNGLNQHWKLVKCCVDGMSQDILQKHGFGIRLLAGAAVLWVLPGNSDRAAR